MPGVDGLGRAGTIIVGVAPNGKPTFLEIVASTALQRALQGALAHAIRTLGTGQWKKLNHEIAAVLATFLHAASIEREEGTLGEALYSIHRIQQGRNSPRIFHTALLHSIIPYFENRISEAHQDVTELRSSGYTWENVSWFRKAWAFALLRVYPPLKFSLGLHDVVQRMLYLTGLSNYASLEHSMLNQAVSRLTAREWDNLRRKLDISRKRQLQALARYKNQWLRWMALNLLRTRFVLADYSKISVVAFVLIYKVLEWWYTKAEDAVKIAGKAIPAPPAPAQHKEGLKLPASPVHCPICRKRRRNPAVLTVTGYVFCYSCILPYVREHRQCPITLTLASESHVRRLYFT